jgi:hypothetical protein
VELTAGAARGARGLDARGQAARGARILGARGLRGARDLAGVLLAIPPTDVVDGARASVACKKSRALV